MTILRNLFMALFGCCLMLTGHTQGAGWNSLKLGRATFSYPRGWHMTRESKEGATRVTLTPDSMQRLTMRMYDMVLVPLDANHTFAAFRKGFRGILSQDTANNRIQKMTDITFKGHKCIYVEMTQTRLPTKAYAIDGGTAIYLIFLIRRRYISVPDAPLERDEDTILNSLTFIQ